MSESTFVVDGINIHISGNISGLMVEDGTYDPNYQEANYLSPYYLRQGDIRCMVKCKTCENAKLIGIGYKKCMISHHRCAKGWIFCDNHSILPEIREKLRIRPERLPVSGGWLQPIR
jgi:hypothetical protein